MPNPSRSDVSRAVERQMRNWELARSQKVTPQPAAGPARAEPFVCISRAVGSGGTQVAAGVGQRLGWPVFDREILQAMAGDDAIRKRIYEQLDERDQTWLEDAVQWLVGGELRKDDYFYRLTETVLALHRRGRAVFLGRGADLILPRAEGLRVRVTAGLETRAQAHAQLVGLELSAARAEVERIDAEREDFRKRHFGKTANDLTRWDLVLNLDHITIPQAEELIVVLLRLRGMVS